MVAYHATITYTAGEQDRLREAIREFVAPRVAQARKQSDIHQRRLQDLQAEQQRLVQLSYKDLIDDEVLAAEQDRIRRERAQARSWNETAIHEIKDVMEALDEALAIVDERSLPYAEAAPNQRRLINQATHERIAPILVDDAKEPRIAVCADRDPFYAEADLFLGKTRLAARRGAGTPGTAPGGRKKTQAPNSRGLGSHEGKMAEGEGFEPSGPGKPAQRFSRPPHSTALPPLQRRAPGDARRCSARPPISTLP